MTEYKKDYFEDRKLKYEKNHGNFIHEFMFTEFSNRIIGQCNVALNDLQRQLDLEIARAKAMEAYLDQKIDTETTRAKAEEVRLDAKIDSESSRAKAEEKRLDTEISTTNEKVLTVNDDLSNLREDVYSDIQDNINPDLNKIKNNINKVLKYSNLYYSNNYDIDEIDDNLKINYTEIMWNDGKYVTTIDDGRGLKDILNSSFAVVATALNDIKTKLDALENK